PRIAPDRGPPLWETANAECVAPRRPWPVGSVASSRDTLPQQACRGVGFPIFQPTISAMAAQTASGKPMIELRKVNKWFGEFHVLRDVDLTVLPGQKLVVCGPSGSGKSTMIRCINRLEEHQKGDIVVDGIELTNDLKNIEAIRREVGMVFQQFNLFPHLTVLENLTLAPIWVRKLPKKEAEETARYYLQRVRIPEQADKYPGQLSGGQQQRVAIARSL